MRATAGATTTTQARPVPAPVWPVGSVWVLTRAVVVILLCTQENNVVGDVEYYRQSLEQLGRLHVSGTLVEYPVPALLLLAAPFAVLDAVGHVGAYVPTVAALAALTDLGFLAALVSSRRWTGRRTLLGGTAAEWAWLAAVPALGATSYARFDLAPGILVGLALLFVVHRPRLAAGFGALATGVKYWPALVLPALGAPGATRRAVVATAGVVGSVLCLLSLALGGWHRLWTPFDYQSVRGLQIESIAATPAMLAWGHGADGYAVGYTRWKAYDVTGPLAASMLHVATVAAALALVVVVGWWLLAWWRLRGRPVSAGGAAEALVWLVLATVGVFMVTNKVLSPQYLLWLLPAAAAGLVVLRGRAVRPLLVWTLGLLVATALTQEIYPRQYGYLLGRFDGTDRIVDLLAARNVLLLALVAYAAGRASLLLLRRPAEVPGRSDLPVVRRRA